MVGNDFSILTNISLFGECRFLKLSWRQHEDRVTQEESFNDGSRDESGSPG